MERIDRFWVGTWRVGGVAFVVVVVDEDDRMLVPVGADKEEEEEEDSFDSASLQRCWARVARARLSA